MYELIQVGANTYYINCPAKIGLYIDRGDAYMIDSGNDKDSARKILKILNEKGWILKVLLNTHSHADHIGGNSLLIQRTGCQAYSINIENSFIQNPILEPSFLYGGYPCKELRNKFLMASESNVANIEDAKLPEGFETVRLDGHTFAMMGIKTPDHIWFLADCLSSKVIIEKYHISFLYDVKGYLKTLDDIEQLEGRLFIPSHADPTEDIKPLAALNRTKIQEIIKLLQQVCKKPTCFEDILKQIFDHYRITMNFNQYVLVGSTIKSYLTYLHDTGKLEVMFEENKLLWSEACLEL